MKHTLVFTLLFGVIAYAYFSAQHKLATPPDLQHLHLGMSVKSLQKYFGNPSAQTRNQLTYVFPDSSELIVTLREGEVSSAQLKYHRPIKIEDPQMRRMTLVQMDSDVDNANRPSWFFAGNPEEGLIYKISSEGSIQSLTWVPPFTYGHNQPKRVGALLKDFQSLHSSKL